MSSSTVNLRALGLNFSANSLELQPGSLIEANNVIIRRDDVVESRRGYKLFGEEIPQILGEPQFTKQLAIYRQRILRHYGSTLAYQDGVLNNGDAKFTEFSGSFTEVQPGLRIKSSQAKNGNFYFTTNEGIKKISAANAFEFNSNANYITQAGGIKALDIQATIASVIGDQESFLPENSTVGYKLVWGKVDANNVEILGTPSERVVVYNPLKTLLQSDFNRLLGTLDLFSSSNSLISDGTTPLNKYTTLSVTKSTNAADLRTKLIDLAKKIDEDLTFATSSGTGGSYEPMTCSGVSVVNGIITASFSTGTSTNYFSNADKIYLTNFKSNSVLIDNLNGAQIVSSVGTGGSGNIVFTARDYTSVNPVGISGSIQSTVVSGGDVTITTTVSHGLKSSQRVTISGTATAVDATHVITVLSPTQFRVTSAGGNTTNLGAWKIVVDGIGEIQSNKYRSITEPSQILANEDTGVIDTRGTGAQLFSQQTYLSTIISLLKAEKTTVIDTTYSEKVGLKTFSLSKTASVNLEFTVPHNIDSTYYYKLYRTATVQVSSTYSSALEDLLPPLDYSLVTQNYYDASLKTLDNTLIINDNVPSAFLNKENLYTNTNTSAGNESKPNDYPPFAHDINTFKGYTFYANTKLKQIKDLELLGVSKLKDELDAGKSPKVIISDGSSLNNCQITFARGKKQEADIAIPASSPVSAAVTKTFLPGNVNTTTDFITITSHGFANNTPLIFKSTGTLPSSIVANTTYYVINQTLNTFQISTSIGGSPVDLTSTGTGTHTASFNTNYIDINSTNNTTKYRIWFDLTGSDIQPDSASRNLIRIFLPANSQLEVAKTLTNTLNSLINDFSAINNSTYVKVLNLNDGVSTITFGQALGPLPTGTGFSVTITTIGKGESVTNKVAIISSDDLLLPSVATQEATKSFIRVLNRNTAEQVDDPNIGFDTYAYYSNLDQPGLFLLEGTTFTDSPYYLISNNSTVGTSFSPDISPLNTNGIGIATSGTKVELTFAAPHGFLNGDVIVISNSSPNIDGVYEVEYISSTVLKIQATISGSGTNTFSYSKSTLAEFSDNYVRKNRIYYSKFEQPEAVSVNVATGNFEVVGSEDAAILRIFPLRDSLFIFKEDGLFRLSAETEPFTISLFDSSCILLAPDSVAVSQNLVYCWTTQGISTVSESGVAIASRPIDTEVLKIQTPNYANFTTATFGIGYESDNSYIVWTVSKPSDTYATQAFRYSSLTGTWTKYKKTNNCGILNSVDDRLYLGLPTLSYIEQERKNFTREDYADYEYDLILGSNNYFGNVLKLPSVQNLKEGDVVTQVQSLTVYQFNSLLKKLDTDPGVTDTDYYSGSVRAFAGNDLRLKMVQLASKLDSDSGVALNDFASTIQNKSGTVPAATLTSPTQITYANHGLFTGRVITITGVDSFPDINGNHVVTVIDANTFSIPIELISFNNLVVGSWTTADNNFTDIGACYNKIIDKLNTDSNVAYNNYQPIETNSLQEAVITNVDDNFKKITLNKTLDFVQGSIVIYSAIPCSVVYAPNTFGDPLSFKHIREATMMFANKAFTAAKLSFSTDLIPAFTDVDFTGDGSGLFGNDSFGYNYFGGVSNSAPFRTIIPMNCQRCRYLNVKFSHETAREQYALYGITLTGKTVSTRAYR